jgi:TRAP-type uncharacterized transport system substrate-binding protein
MMWELGGGERQDERPDGLHDRQTVIEKKDELVAVHQEARNITIDAQALGSPIPFHPGAKKYFEEHGVKFK